jgi:DNA-binding LacI/PurR family transcriptional regulator
MRRAFETTKFRVPAFVYSEADDAESGHRSDLAERGIPALIRHLAELGHRSFVHVAGPETWSPSRNRRLAYETTVQHDGFSSAGILHGNWSAKSAYDAVSQLPELPAATAYVAANDQMALGVMLALKERGLRIPEDVSVVGIDDIPEAAYFDPPLTTVRIDFESRGRHSLLTLLARIEKTPPPALDIAPAELMIRRSSGPAPAR